MLGQVRDGDQSRQTEAPIDLYGDFGVAGLPHGTTLDTYFRLEHDFGLNQTTDRLLRRLAARAGRHPGRRLHARPPDPQRSAGRRLRRRLREGAHRSRLARRLHRLRRAAALLGADVRVAESSRRDEQIFGGSVRTTRWKSGYLSLGYLQQNREQRVLHQLVSLSGARSFTQLPGLPNVYGLSSYDADHQNLDQATAGVRASLAAAAAGQLREQLLQAAGQREAARHRHQPARGSDLPALLGQPDAAVPRRPALHADAQRCPPTATSPTSATSSRPASSTTATSAAPACSGCPAATGSKWCAGVLRARQRRRQRQRRASSTTRTASTSASCSAAKFDVGLLREGDQPERHRRSAACSASAT